MSKKEELFIVHTGSAASALDTVLGPAATTKTTRGDWIRRCIDKGLCYGVRDEDNGWFQLHLEEMFCLVVTRQLRDLGVPYPQIGELLEQLEFGGVDKVSVVRKKGSVTVTHEVNQRAAMREALWALRVANNREHGSQIKLPQKFGSPAVSTVFSNATLH